MNFVCLQWICILVLAFATPNGVDLAPSDKKTDLNWLPFECETLKDQVHLNFTRQILIQDMDLYFYLQVGLDHRAQ